MVCLADSRGFQPFLMTGTNVYNPFRRVVHLIDGHTGVVPPGPFSNPEVKRALVDRGTGIFLGAAPTLSINLFIKKVDQKTILMKLFSKVSFAKKLSKSQRGDLRGKSPVVVCRLRRAKPACGSALRNGRAAINLFLTRNIDEEPTCGIAHKH